MEWRKLKLLALAASFGIFLVTPVASLWGAEPMGLLLVSVAYYFYAATFLLPAYLAFGTRRWWGTGAAGLLSLVSLYGSFVGGLVTTFAGVLVLAATAIPLDPAPEQVQEVVPELEA